MQTNPAFEKHDRPSFFFFKKTGKKPLTNDDSN